MAAKKKTQSGLLIDGVVGSSEFIESISDKRLKNRAESRFDKASVMTLQHRFPNNLVNNLYGAIGSCKSDIVAIGVLRHRNH